MNKTNDKNRTNEEIVKEVQDGVNITSNMEQLYNQNRGFMVMVCKMYMLDGVELDDLLQECYFALVDAIKTYDAEKGKFISWLKFSLMNTIKGYISKGGASGLHLSVDMREQLTKYKRAFVKLQNDNGRTPTDEEIAKYLGTDEETIELYRTLLVSVKSIDEPVQGTDGEMLLGDVIPSGENMENDIIEEMHTNHIIKILKENAESREGYIITEHLLKGRGFRDIGNELEISHERARQLYKRGMHNLRKLPQVKALVEKKEKIECLEYRGGYRGWKNRGYRSNVEIIAERNEELRNKYQRMRMR